MENLPSGGVDKEREIINKSIDGNSNDEKCNRNKCSRKMTIGGSQSREIIF